MKLYFITKKIKKKKYEKSQNYIKVHIDNMLEG